MVRERMRLELVELSDIVDAALRRKRKALERHAVEVALPPDLPMLKLDLFLMEHALANVLDKLPKRLQGRAKAKLHEVNGHPLPDRGAVRREIRAHGFCSRLGGAGRLARLILRGVHADRHRRDARRGV